MLRAAFNELVGHEACHLLQLLSSAKVVDCLQLDAALVFDTITFELFFALCLDSVALLLMEISIAARHLEED